MQEGTALARRATRAVARAGQPGHGRGGAPRTPGIATSMTRLAVRPGRPAQRYRDPDVAPRRTWRAPQLRGSAAPRGGPRVRRTAISVTLVGRWSPRTRFQRADLDRAVNPISSHSSAGGFTARTASPCAGRRRTPRTRLLSAPGRFAGKRVQSRLRGGGRDLPRPCSATRRPRLPPRRDRAEYPDRCACPETPRRASVAVAALRRSLTDEVAAAQRVGEHGVGVGHPARPGSSPSSTGASSVSTPSSARSSTRLRRPGRPHRPRRRAPCRRPAPGPAPRTPPAPGTAGPTSRRRCRRTARRRTGRTRRPAAARRSPPAPGAPGPATRCRARPGRGRCAPAGSAPRCGAAWRDPLRAPPFAKRSSISWSSRASPADPHGTFACVAQRAVSSICIGSSSGRPHWYSPRLAPARRAPCVPARSPARRPRPASRRQREERPRRGDARRWRSG